MYRCIVEYGKNSKLVSSDPIDRVINQGFINMSLVSKKNSDFLFPKEMFLFAVIVFGSHLMLIVF